MESLIDLLRMRTREGMAVARDKGKTARQAAQGLPETPGEHHIIGRCGRSRDRLSGNGCARPNARNAA
jgi:hypothetical protein